MKISALISPAAGFSYDEIKRLAVAADESGLATFSVSDHFFGGTGAPDQDCLEAWTLLAALARETTRVRVGTMVTSVSYRNPALLAKIAASVDAMSSGRVDFGIGAGWKENEYRAYGYVYPDAKTRVAELKDALEICTRMWTEERATYAGAHHSIENALCAPKPVQRPMPIRVGGVGPYVMRLAARYAHAFDRGHGGGVTGTPTPDHIRQTRATLDEELRTAGRTVRLEISLWDQVDLNDANVRETETRLREYAAAGLDEYYFAVRREGGEAIIRLAGRELVPKLA